MDISFEEKKAAGMEARAKGNLVWESRPSRPVTNNDPKRSRTRSPERRDRPRSDSRERYRDSRRNRSPNGYHDEENRASSYDRRGAPPGAAREQRMSQVRESSQQDRRVYVGNLPYEVSWQSLKAFMKEGTYRRHYSPTTAAHDSDFLTAGDVLFADILLLPNGMSKVINIVARDPGFFGCVGQVIDR